MEWYRNHVPWGRWSDQTRERVSEVIAFPVAFVVVAIGTYELIFDTENMLTFIKFAILAACGVFFFLIAVAIVAVILYVLLHEVIFRTR